MERIYVIRNRSGAIVEPVLIRESFPSRVPSERSSVLCEGHYGYKHSTLGLEKKSPSRTMALEGLRDNGEEGRKAGAPRWRGRCRGARNGTGEKGTLFQ